MIVPSRPDSSSFCGDQIYNPEFDAQAPIDSKKKLLGSKCKLTGSKYKLKFKCICKTHITISILSYMEDSNFMSTEMYVILCD